MFSPPLCIAGGSVDICTAIFLWIESKLKISVRVRIWGVVNGNGGVTRYLIKMINDISSISSVYFWSFKQMVVIRILEDAETPIYCHKQCLFYCSDVCPKLLCTGVFSFAFWWRLYFLRRNVEWEKQKLLVMLLVPLIKVKRTSSAQNPLCDGAQEHFGWMEIKNQLFKLMAWPRSCLIPANCGKPPQTSKPGVVWRSA